MKYFYVTRKESAGFVGLLTLDEILARLDTGELKDSFLPLNLMAAALRSFGKAVMADGERWLRWFFRPNPENWSKVLTPVPRDGLF